MDNIMNQMLEKYDVKTSYDKKNAIKEIMQEIVLCGLSRANFFKDVAFYGGTALRIFYGLDRFSEDLDFSLKVSDPNFDLEKYFPVLEKEIRSFGMNVEIDIKHKVKESDIKSAFLKSETKELLLLFYPNEHLEGVSGNEKIKIKFEIDVNPPRKANYETQYRLLPSPYEIQLYDAPSLFAGKLHAVLCRGWANRVKGRDLYDYIFYLQKGISLNLEHLNERLKQTKHISEDKDCSLDDIKKMLIDRFMTIDFAQAKSDVVPFIKDTTLLDIWNKDFFIQITSLLTVDLN